MQDSRDLERVRRRIFLRANLYTWGFLAAALVVAVGGSGLVAWLLSRTGLPFATTWVVITAIVLLPSLLGMVVRAVRERSNRSRSP
jgi:hypothetical protein